MLFCDIPSTIEESFYTGQVYVGLKDSIFEPSSALRHASELSKVITQQNLNPVLVMYSDGGPDHIVAFLKTQLSLISSWTCYIYICTSPYHFWKNLCERVNCILASGDRVDAVFHVGWDWDVQLDRGNSRFGQSRTPRSLIWLAGKCEIANVIDISAVGSQRETFSSLWGCQQTSNGWIVECCWWFGPQSWSPHEDLSKCPTLYGPLLPDQALRLSIKKCGKQGCTICLPPRLTSDVFSTLAFLPDPVPDPDNDQHYKSFDALYGTLTSEQHRPSLKDSIYLWLEVK